MIRLKNAKDLAMLRRSGRLLAEVLKILAAEARAGITLQSLDYHARTLIEQGGGKPAFLGYKPEGSKKPYPAAICTSVNDQIVHGVPSDYVLKEGDILKIDCGVNYKGYFTDSALTVGIGKISSSARKLINVTKEALTKAIEVCLPGNHIGDIGWKIENYVKKNNFSIIKGLTGHGVGFAIHEDPTVYNYGKKGEGLKLQSGLVLAIEPMTSVGSGETRQLPDESFAAKDGSLTAHFEHTVYIGEDGPEVLTNFL